MPADPTDVTDLPVEAQELATRWQRFICESLDAFLASLPSALVVLAGKAGVVIPGAAILASVAGAAYLLFADALTDGQSLGKRWMGMQVIDARTGAPCSVGQSLGRNLMMVLGPIDALFIFGDRRQRLGDKLARTIVVLPD